MAKKNFKLSMQIKFKLPPSQRFVLYHINIKVKEKGQEQRLMVDQKEVDALALVTYNAYIPPACLYIQGLKFKQG